MKRIILKTEDDAIQLISNNEGVNVYEVEIYPDAARALLQINCKNRPVQHIQVSRLAAAIKASDWRLINNGIAIDSNGDMIDGQHRLHACVLADQPITVFLHIGLAPDSRSAIDVGKKRSVNDALAMSGRISSSHHAAAINLLKSYSEGTIRPFSAGKGMSITITADHASVLRFTDSLDYELLNTIVNQASRATNQVQGLRRSAWIAALYLISVKHSSKVDEFRDAVVEGEGLMLGNPALTLRNSCWRYNAARNDWHMCLYIKAWNAWFSNRSLQVLRFQDSESIPEVK